MPGSTLSQQTVQRAELRSLLETLVGAASRHAMAPDSQRGPAISTVAERAGAASTASCRIGDG